MKLLTVVVLAAIFSGAHSGRSMVQTRMRGENIQPKLIYDFYKDWDPLRALHQLFDYILSKVPLSAKVASTEDINEAKTKVLSWFNKVESSLNSGVQKLSADFAEKVQTTSSDIRSKFEEHKQKFANSEYSSKLAELADSLAAKQVEISKDVEKTLAKASVEVHQQMEETKKHLKGIRSEGKEQLLKWLTETEKKVNGGVQKLSKDFTAQLETTSNDLREKIAKSEYAGKLSELSDTLKVKHEEISKDVVKTIARVSEDVKAQLDQAKAHIKNIKIWMQDEL